MQKARSAALAGPATMATTRSSPAGSRSRTGALARGPPAPRLDVGRPFREVAGASVAPVDRVPDALAGQHHGRAVRQHARQRHRARRGASRRLPFQLVERHRVVERRTPAPRPAQRRQVRAGPERARRGRARATARRSRRSSRPAASPGRRRPREGRWRASSRSTGAGRRGAGAEVGSVGKRASGPAQLEDC